MAFKLRYTMYAGPNGDFGGGDLITFDESDLTPEQWGRLEVLEGTDRFNYLYAIMAGEPLTEWEND